MAQVGCCTLVEVECRLVWALCPLEEETEITKTLLTPGTRVDRCCRVCGQSYVSQKERPLE